jgi:hypothetical protein
MSKSAGQMAKAAWSEPEFHWLTWEWLAEHDYRLEPLRKRAEAFDYEAATDWEWLKFWYEEMKPALSVIVGWELRDKAGDPFCSSAAYDVVYETLLEASRGFSE